MAKNFDFNAFLDKLEAIAESIVKRYTTADDAVTDARQKLDALPHGGPFSVEQARRGVAEAELRKLGEERARMPRLCGDDTRAALEQLRGELETALIGVDDAVPEQVDMAAMELLRSGIQRARELARMYDKFGGNITMQRLIAAEADRRVRGNVELLPGEREALITVVADSRQLGGGRYLEAFRQLESVILRMAEHGSYAALMPLFVDAVAQLREGV